MLLAAVVVAGSLFAADEGGSDEALSNQDIISLLKAGLDKALVEEKIKSSDNIFDLSTKAMIHLKEEGVPDDIIRLMLSEMRTKRDRLRSKISLQIQQLAAERPEARDAAFMFLSRLGETALPQLRKALENTRPEIREAAVVALTRLGDEGCVETVRHMLVDSEAKVRYAAAENIARQKDVVSLELARKSLNDGVNPLDGYIHLLGAAKDLKSAGSLRMKLMEDPVAENREQAAWALGQMQLMEAREDLEHTLMKDRTASVRAAAALALGELKHPDSINVLIQSCKTDPETRVCTLNAMASSRPAVAIRFLITTLQHKLTEPETEAALASLRRLTKQDLGPNPALWQIWWDKNRALIEGGEPVPDETIETPLAPARTETPPPPPIFQEENKPEPGQVEAAKALENKLEQIPAPIPDTPVESERLKKVEERLRKQAEEYDQKKLLNSLPRKSDDYSALAGEKNSVGNHVRGITPPPTDNADGVRDLTDKLKKIFPDPPRDADRELDKIRKGGDSSLPKKSDEDTRMVDISQTSLLVEVPGVIEVKPTRKSQKETGRVLLATSQDTGKPVQQPLVKLPPLKKEAPVMTQPTMPTMPVAPAPEKKTATSSYVAKKALEVVKPTAAVSSHNANNPEAEEKLAKQTEKQAVMQAEKQTKAQVEKQALTQAEKTVEPKMVVSVPEKAQAVSAPKEDKKERIQEVKAESDEKHKWLWAGHYDAGEDVGKEEKDSGETPLFSTDEYDRD
jgi:HEAT repeat protein